jgi:hypothetical protein
MSNKLQELQNITNLMKITYDNLAGQFPNTASRNYKSNLKRFIKSTMDYDLVVEKENIINLIKIIKTKKKGIKHVVGIIKMDLKDIRQDYHKISNTYSELIKQKYSSNLVITNSAELAGAMTEYDIESTSSRNHLSAQLIKASESAIKSRLCYMTLEVKKNETTLKLLKKIEYHLNFSLSKYC